MIYRLSGKLNIPERKYEYGLFENSTMDIKYLSIDRFLEYIYMNSPNSNVSIKVNLKDKQDKKKYSEIFSNSGELFKAKNKNGVYDWHVGNYKDSKCLGDILFNNVDESIQVLIEDIDFKKYVKDTELLHEVLYGANSYQ